MNISPYTISAFIILDTEGNHVFAKYYRFKSHPHGEAADLVSLKDQKAFEKGLWQKTKKAGGDIILYGSHLVVYRHLLSDLILYFVAGPTENAIMLYLTLTSLADALTMLLRKSFEKRGGLENLDLVLFCLNGTIDDGIVAYTNPAAIASRVTLRPDTTEIVISEKTS